MTGLLLAFTGRAVAITNQYETPYCVAHAVATCGSLYGYNDSPQYYVNKLGIGDNGYNVNSLPQALYKMRIGRPRKYTREQFKKEIQKGPLLMNVAQTRVNIYGEYMIDWHLMCAVGYNDNYAIPANSFGTGRGTQGYGMVASGDLQFVTFQKLGSKTLTPSLIQLTDSGENVEEKQVTEILPDTNIDKSKKRSLNLGRMTRD